MAKQKYGQKQLAYVRIFREREKMKCIDFEKVEKIMQEKNITIDSFEEQAGISVFCLYRHIKSKDNQKLFCIYAPFLTAKILRVPVNRILTDEFIKEYKVRKPPKIKK